MRSRFLALGALLVLFPAEGFARMSYVRLTRALENAQSKEKPLIIKAIGRTKRKRAARELAVMFDIRTGSPEISKAIVEALGSLGRKESAGVLLDAWEYLEELRRKMALPAHLQILRADIIEALGKIGDRNVLTVLRRGLRDDDSLVAQRAAEALGLMRDKRSVDGLIGLLSSRDRNTAQSAYEALGAMGGDAADRVLMDGVEDERVTIRIMSAFGLARMEKRIGITLLESHLDDEPDTNGIFAAYYLGRLGEISGLDYLVRASKKGGSPLRPKAIEALGKTGELRAILPLIEVMGKASPGIRLMCVLSMGRIGGDRAIFSLKKLLKDRNPGIRSAARVSLAGLGFYEKP